MHHNFYCSILYSRLKNQIMYLPETLRGHKQSIVLTKTQGKKQ